MLASRYATNFFRAPAVCSFGLPLREGVEAEDAEFAVEEVVEAEGDEEEEEPEEEELEDKAEDKEEELDEEELEDEEEAEEEELEEEEGRDDEEEEEDNREDPLGAVEEAGAELLASWDERESLTAEALFGERAGGDEGCDAEEAAPAFSVLDCALVVACEPADASSKGRRNGCSCSNAAYLSLMSCCISSRNLCHFLVTSGSWGMMTCFAVGADGESFPSRSSFVGSIGQMPGFLKASATVDTESTQRFQACAKILASVGFGGSWFGCS